MEQIKKFVCNTCDFKTNYKSKWEIHIETELHKTGKKKTRSDKLCPEKCPSCDYKTKSNTNMKEHILNKHKTKEDRKTGFKYYCEYCDYGAFMKLFYEKHEQTQKHKNIMDVIVNKT
jgi:hypothetical protein